MKEYKLIHVMSASSVDAANQLERIVQQYIGIGFVPIGSPTVSCYRGLYTMLLYLVKEK